MLNAIHGVDTETSIVSNIKLPSFQGKDKVYCLANIVSKMRAIKLDSLQRKLVKSHFAEFILKDFSFSK